MSSPLPGCPVCGTVPTGPPAAPCPACGLPAAGQAGWVVARIDATLAELSRDRDALLATLRASAPGAASAWAPPEQSAAPAWAPTYAAAPPAAPPPAAAPAPWAPPPSPPPAAGSPGAEVPGGAPAATPFWPAPVPGSTPAPPPRRRLSPQQVLLGLGALLLVAGALAFVALGWTRFGLVFQAAVMVAGTAACCGASAWAARRALRATEEALAAAGAALLAVDLGAAHARGLGRLEEVPLRPWTAVSCLVVVAVALLLGRLTRTTVVWPLAALLAAQPVPLLLLPDDLLLGPAGVALALVAAALDVTAATALRPAVAPVARVLAGLWAGAGVVGGLLLAAAGTPAESWTATALLAAAGTGAVAALRVPRLAAGTPGTAAVVPVASAAAAVVGLALTGSLATTGPAGPVVAAALGLLLLTATAAVSGPAPLGGPLPPAALAAVRSALRAAGAATAGVGALLLADADRDRPLAALALAATVPAVLTALRVPAVRPVATATALATPALAVLLAQEGGVFPAPTAGLLLALLAAGAFALATALVRRPEEPVCAAGGALVGVLAGVTSSGAEAWGQVAVQLSVVGVAAGCYALLAHRRLVAVAAVADLVLACWTAVGGAGIETPEAYTLPAAVGLLVVAWPRLRARGPSWGAEGAAAGVALVPSALLVAGSPSALRLVLVVAGAVGLVVVGTVAHRQAPFVLGAGALAFVTATRLGPYAPLVPPPLTLSVAGVLLVVLGVTYERRLQQAREAVAWVAQMS